MELILEELGGIHLHCSTCYSFTRCSQEDDACDNIPCRLSCSQIYHACKEFEHISELCPNARIPCLNAEYGCGLEILRRDMGAHLSVCPASLIVCTAEWHRLPIYSSHRSQKGAILNVNPLPKSGQLDYELAMRDQFIIQEALKSKGRPTSKLSKYIFRKERSMEDNDLQTLKQLEHWNEELKERVKGLPIPMKYWEFPELQKGNIHAKHCSHCVLKDCSGDSDNFCPINSCAWGCDAKFHACKSSEHSLICKYYKQPNDFDWIYRGMARVVDRKSLQEYKSPSRLKSNNASEMKLPPSRLFPVHKHHAQSSKGKTVNGSWVPDPPPPPPFPEFWNSCRFDIRYDFINNKRDRQKGMHAVRCHEELRRDQYLWHYQNIHSEIISELSGWIESRCPLNGYGCNFAVRRLYPADEKREKTLTFNRFTGTFALANTEPSSHLESSKANDLGLQLLPLEILSMIFAYLDPSSLYNLSVTCKYLREICQSLLPAHGCVSPQWESKTVEGRINWSISYYRWFYSSAFDPIRKWRIENLGAVSNHLSECPFYQKRKQDVPDQGFKDQWTPVLKQLKVKIRCHDM